MTQRPRNTALVNAPTTRGDGQKKELSSAKRRNSARSGKVHTTSSSDAMRKKEQLGTMSHLVGGAAIAVVAILAVLASTSVFEPFRDATRSRGGGTGSVSGSSHGKDDSAAIRLFLEWFDASGGVRHEHIGITSFPAMGKGIVAEEAIQEHDQLLFVPMDIIICRETIAQVIPSSLQSKFAKLHGAQDELLTAFLLLEMAKHESSSWFPYLQLLPQLQPESDPASSSASPLFYSSVLDVNALQDERMISAAQQERKQAKRAFQKFRRLFQSVPPSSSPSSFHIGLRVYSWARFLISSRAFTIHGQRYLVPFGDVFNGQGHQSTRKFENGQRFLQYHQWKDRGMVIRADRSTDAKQQVFEDYGDNSNYIYFLYHGFLMPDNPFDCASFRFPRLQASDETTDDHVLAMKMQVLSHFGVEDGPMGCIARDGRISQESQQLARFYFTLHETDARDMEDECGLKTNYVRCFLPSASTVISDHDFVEYLAHAIQKQIKAFPSSLDEDLEMVRNGSALVPQRSAIEFRISRKQMLQEALTQLLLEITNTETVDREHGGDEHDSAVVPPGPSSNDPSARIRRFQQWVESHDLPINHLELKYVDDVMGYGTFATKPLVQGEIYLSVPVDMVMDLQSASQSTSLQRLIRSLGRRGRRHAVGDGTLLLVLHLLDEKFGPSRSKSQWLPYLDVLPSVESMSTISPLFFDEHAHMDLLRATDLFPLMVKYRERVTQSFRFFHQQLRDAGSVAHNPLSWITAERFLWATAILDSRSIWWSGQRHLVPLLDMVNCLDLGSGHAVHHTTLDDHGGHHAITKASWPFAAGDQVVENYAQPNYIYLLYHGFVLDDGKNQHDCAHFCLDTKDRDAIDALAQARKRVVMAMLEALGLQTWTPELCVDPLDPQSVARFAKIAFVTESPIAALELDGQEAAAQQGRLSTAALKPQEIDTALEVVISRMLALQDGLRTTNSVDEEGLDNRSRMIRKYMTQQLAHMANLRAAFDALSVAQ